LDRVTRQSSSHGVGKSARVALIGGAVTAYALLDAYLLGPVVIELSAWFDPFVVFGLAAAVLTLVNVACCSWLERRGGRRPVERRRILLASAAYSITFAAFFAAVGFGAGDAVRAL
jgi:hypothetical protein